MVLLSYPHSLVQNFSDFNQHMSPLEVLWKHWHSFSRSGMSPEILNSLQVPQWCQWSWSADRIRTWKRGDTTPWTNAMFAHLGEIRHCAVAKNISNYEHLVFSHAFQSLQERMSALWSNARSGIIEIFQMKTLNGLRNHIYPVIKREKENYTKIYSDETVHFLVLRYTDKWNLKI